MLNLMLFVSFIPRLQCLFAFFYEFIAYTKYVTCTFISACPQLSVRKNNVSAYPYPMTLIRVLLSRVCIWQKLNDTHHFSVVKTRLFGVKFFLGTRAGRTIK